MFSEIVAVANELRRLGCKNQDRQALMLSLRLMKLVGDPVPVLPTGIEQCLCVFVGAGQPALKDNAVSVPDGLRDLHFDTTPPIEEAGLGNQWHTLATDEGAAVHMNEKTDRVHGYLQTW